MKCETCPVVLGGCLGESVPRLCLLARTRDDYRKQLVRVALGNNAGPKRVTPDIQVLLEAVSRCPYRGNVLAPGLQPECGCSELSECDAGLGETPGRVTTSDCLACVVERLNR
jgi:hypothetical protein